MRKKDYHVNIPSWYADYVQKEIQNFYKEFPHLICYWAAKVFGMLMLWREYRKGFSNSQRAFIHEVFGYQCSFYEKNPKTGLMERCTFKKMEDIQVHHLAPSGWFDRKNLKSDLGKNDIRNALPLCSKHHYIIHPDIPLGFKRKHMGDPNGFERLFIRRVLCNMHGMVYWDNTWDKLMRRINKFFIEEYSKNGKSIRDYPILESRRNFPQFPILAKKLPLARIR